MTYYQPFVCGPVIKTSKEYECLTTLFRGYLMNDKRPEAVSYGLGPLWIIAERDGKVITKLIINNPTGIYKYDYLLNYSGYRVRLPETQFGGNGTYEKVNLYFPPGDKKFVDHVEWVLEEGDEGIVEARAKLTAIDTSKPTANVFELPVGYGCEGQLEDGDNNLDRLIEPDHLLIHDRGTPELLDLEVTASKPIDDLMYSWNSNKYSVKLVRGQIDSGSSDVPKVYYTTLTLERDYKTSRLKRQKKIWSSRSDLDDATCYSIDETTGRQSCKVNHLNAHDYVSFLFPGQEQELNPISVSLGALADLHTSYFGYKKISAGEYIAPGRFKNAVFERRFSNYTLNANGGVFWPGPMSVVKQLSTYSSFYDSLRIDNDYNPEYHTTMSLLLFSNDAKILLYKVTFDIVDRHELSMPKFVSHLDLTPCVPAGKSEALILKYPIEDLDRIGELESNRDTILSIFSGNVLKQTPILPLQLSNLELTFDNFYAYLRMNILDLSSYQTFELVPKERLKIDKDPLALVETTASSLVKCSLQCDFYGCYRFSYEEEQLRCRLEVKNGKTQMDIAANSMTYKYRQPDLKSLHPSVTSFLRLEEESETGRHHLSPRLIEELFQSILEDNRSTGKDNLLRLIHHTGDPQGDIVLTPIALHSDIDSLKELVKQEEGVNALPDAGELVVIGSENMELQYRLVLDNRKFAKNEDRVSEISAATYENCAQACDDDGECKSFSYCRSTFVCLITRKWSQSKELADRTMASTGCSVYTLDELSKFEDFGLALRPTEVTKGPERVDMTRDCASSCLDDTQINCQGFYACPSKSDNFKLDCLYTDRHLSNDFNKHRPEFISRNADKAMSLRDVVRKVLKQECRFYSRSYLAQFDQYHGKTIEFPTQDLELTRIVLKGVSAEKCARRCIERQCLAFDICVESNSRFFNQVCQMATKEIRHSHLITKAGCTTFALSDRSQFKKYAATKNETQKFEGDKPDKEALNQDTLGPAVILDPEELKAEEDDINSNVFEYLRSKFTHVHQSVDGSHWLAHLLCLVIGIMMGAGGLSCANEIYARHSRQRLQ